MTKGLIILALLLPLCACSSKPIAINYYLLHQPASSSAPVTADITAQNTLFLRSVNAPEYLKQRNLSMQINANEVHLAPQHLWAEPFISDFKLALAKTFSSNHNIHLETEPEWLTAPQDTDSLDIRLVDFISTFDGQIILSGDFRLNLKHQDKVVMRSFHFTLPLEQDGFSHAIKKMRVLVAQLTMEIAYQVNHEKSGK